MSYPRQILTMDVAGYLSVIKALEHSAMRCDRKLNLVWIDSDHLEDNMQEGDSSKYYSAWSQLTAASGSAYLSSSSTTNLDCILLRSATNP